MQDKEVPKLVVLSTEESNQQMIINGELVSQKVTVLRCPCCHFIIYNFGQEINPITLRQVVTHDAASLYEIAHYCPHCGQKLYYEREVIDEQNGE